MFKRRTKEQDRKETECPEKTAGVKKAERVAAQYQQLSRCCALLSAVADKERNVHGAFIYGSSWRVGAYDITTAGIDIEEVYEHIGRLARKRKLELEIELGKLDA